MSARRLLLFGFFSIVVGVGGLALAQQENQTGEQTEEPDAVTKGETADDAQPAPEPPSDGRVTPQPTPEDIIEAFERDRPTNKPVSPRQWQNTALGRRPSPSSTSLLRQEGDYLSNEPGRIVRDGPWWTLVFESDSSDAPQPPMRILPNLQLERLVLETSAAAEKPMFLVSGEMTIFEGRNYVLIRKALRRRTPSNLDK